VHDSEDERTLFPAYVAGQNAPSTGSMNMSMSYSSEGCQDGKCSDDGAQHKVSVAPS
jgi:hypothetical protein